MGEMGRKIFCALEGNDHMISSKSSLPYSICVAKQTIVGQLQNCFKLFRLQFGELKSKNIQILYTME